MKEYYKVYVVKSSKESASHQVEILLKNYEGKTELNLGEVEDIITEYKVININDSRVIGYKVYKYVEELYMEVE